MSDFMNPLLWNDFNSIPSMWWEAMGTDDHWYFYNDTGSFGGGSATNFEPAGTAPVFAVDTEIDWEVLEARLFGSITFVLRYFTSADFSTSTSVTIPASVVGTGSFTIPAGTTMYGWQVRTDNLPKIYNGVLTLADAGVVEPPDPILYDIALTWTAGSVGSYPLADHRLFRSIDGAAFTLLTTVLAGQPLMYLDQLVTSESTYEYYVITRDTLGNESPQSSPTLELLVPPA